MTAEDPDLQPLPECAVLLLNAGFIHPLLPERNPSITLLLGMGTEHSLLEADLLTEQRHLYTMIKPVEIDHRFVGDRHLNHLLQ